MKTNSKFFLIIIISFILTSCDRRECINENTIFDKYEPGDLDYNKELIKQIEEADKSKIRYWLKEIEGEDLVFYVQDNKNLCACLKGKPDGTKFDKIIEKKALGRRGAEFVNLVYSVVNEENTVSFAIKDYDFMID